MTDQVNPGENASEDGIAAATEMTINQIGEGDFSGLTTYATQHLGPAVVYASLGLAVIFIGYRAAHCLSKVISRPICRRVEETLGRFVAKLIFYSVLLSVTRQFCPSWEHHWVVLLQCWLRQVLLLAWLFRVP